MTRGWTIRFVTLHCLLVSITMPSTVSTITDKDHVTRVVGVVGGRVDLPCDVTPRQRSDATSLVLWYKNSDGFPIVSYDARAMGTSSDVTPTQHPDYDSRVLFNVHETPALLRLARLTRADEGVYRCRVDFHHGPTRNRRVQLSVAVPPEPPVILYEGRPVAGVLTGLREGQTPTLRCRSQGGRPRPRVTWYRGAALLDDSDRWEGPAGHVTVVNDLTLSPLSRADLHATLVCSATSNNTHPMMTQVSLDIDFSPLNVRILDADVALLAGRAYNIVCSTFGARPPANLVWKLANKRLRTAVQTVSADQNMTTSTLTLVPRVVDQGRRLTCAAETAGARAARQPIDGAQLNVHYAPLVTLRLGAALDPTDIREGGDVYFDCSVVANPPALPITWRRDDAELQSTPGPRDVVSVRGRSLVLRAVSRHLSGAYVCGASNSEGTGTSRPVHLSIKYAPRCKPGQRTRYATAVGQPSHVTCQVDADPAHVTFSWLLRTTVEVIQLPAEQAVSEGGQSRLSFTPSTELELGTLYCHAENRVGKMQQPCVFALTPAERPGAVRNCTALSAASSLDVRCAAGFDGGLSQYFVAELYDATSGRLVRNLTRPFPEFSVAQLPAGLELRLLLYAANSRGRSEVLTVQTVVTEQPAGSRYQRRGHGDETSSFRVTPVLAVLIGLVVTLMLLAIAAVVCIRHRVHDRRAARHLSSGGYARSAEQKRLGQTRSNDGVAMELVKTPSNDSQDVKTLLQPNGTDVRISAAVLAAHRPAIGSGNAIEESSPDASRSSSAAGTGETLCSVCLQSIKEGPSADYPELQPFLPRRRAHCQHCRPGRATPSQVGRITTPLAARRRTSSDANSRDGQCRTLLIGPDRESIV